MSRYTVDNGNRCPVDRSILRTGGRCMACGYIQRPPSPPRVVVDGLVYDADKAPLVTGIGFGTLKVEDYMPRRESSTPDVSPMTNDEAFDWMANQIAEAEAARITDTPVIPAHLVCPDCMKPCGSNAGLAAHRRSKHKEPVHG